MDKHYLFEAIERWRKYRIWGTPLDSEGHKACCEIINNLLETHNVYIDLLPNGRYRWRIVKHGRLGRILPTRGRLNWTFDRAARELGAYLYTKAYIKYNKDSATSYKIS